MEMFKSSKSYQSMFKAVISASMITGTIVATASPVGASTNGQTFSDLDPKKDYYDAVLQLAARGIINGFPDGTYKPESFVTRGQAAKILAASLKLDTKSVKNPGFSDLTTDNEFYGSIAALAETGVLNGFPDKTFRPNDKLTRSEMAKILVLGYKLQESSSKDHPFHDVKNTSAFASYINTIFKHGITKGTSATTFSPSDSVTRGQIASFVVRTEVAIEKKPETPPTQPPSTGGETPKEFELNIMHFNDTHAHLDNAAKRVTAVKEVRAKKPDALLLDAGDVFSGTLYFNEFQGQADLEFMNLMKVDAMTFGNHEFDLGSSPEGHQALVDFIRGANFPFVSANVDFSKDEKFTSLFNTKISKTPEKGNIYTGIVKEVKGEKIGIFGLTTADTKDISSPGEITFSNYIEDAKKMVAEFEKMGINKIVAITHIGFDDNPAVDNDLELAKAVEGIDVIVGGHSHTELKEPVVIDKKTSPTIIVQAYQYADYLGTLDVTFDKNGVVTKHNGQLIKIGDLADDPEAEDLLKKYSDRIAEIKTTPTGATAEIALENPRTGGDNTKPSVRKNETPLGNVITDGMLAKARQYNANVIMALQNGGGIRAAIDKGPITVGEVIEVLPFGNTLALMELTGAELKQAFEKSVSNYPLENGGFLHVSGSKVEFDSSKPVGERIVSIKYHDGDSFVDIQDEETYTIATNAFTAKGGDGFDVFKKIYEEGRVIDLGLSDWENFAEHLRTLTTVNPQMEGRIIDVAGRTTLEMDGAEFSGTAAAPKVYNGNVIVNVTGTSVFEHVTVLGNLMLKGQLEKDAAFRKITVKGNLDLSQLLGTEFDFEDIQVDGESIF